MAKAISLDNIVAEGTVVIDFVDKAFAPGDITNLTGLTARLNLPQFDDAVALFVREQLAAPTHGVGEALRRGHEYDVAKGIGSRLEPAYAKRRDL